jgi:hypothetical protein
MNMYPTVIIGIGGSGKLVCKFLKKNFAERFPKEWINPSTGLPPIINLSIIETEPGKEKEELSLPDLPDVPTIAAHIDEKTLKAMQKKNFLNKNPQIEQWLFPNLPIKEIIGGAGQIRQAGRLAFFRHRAAYGKIKEAITTAVNSVRSDEAINFNTHLSKGGIQVPDRTPRCYIITSVCGGTGSGMLLDIAGIVKNLELRTNLIAFLPKMFESVIDLPESIWQLYSNTYATLKEINHYMTGGRWEVCYDTKKKDTVKLEEKLFDYCFLVEKESETIDLKDRLHISPLVGEFLFWMISELEHPLYTTDVNIRKFVEAETSNWCDGLGISSVSFPLEDIRRIMVNWGIRELITKHISVDFAQSEIENEIINSNTGYLYSDFSYNNWEDALLDKNQYSTLSAETLIKRRGTLNNKIREEKNRLKREYDGDLRRMKEGFEEYLITVNKKFKNLTDEILITKGPGYYAALLDRFESELNNVEMRLEDEQLIFMKNVSQLDATAENNIKWLTKIGRKKWFMDIGWSKRIQPHVESILRVIKSLFDLLLKVEKHKHTFKIIVKIKDLIDLRKKEHLSLCNKLNTLRIKKEGEEKKIWDILTFGSDAQIKVKSDRNDVEKFYEDYLQKKLNVIATDLRKRLVDWREILLEEILNEIDLKINESISQSGFNDMTILDAMKTNMEELGKKVQDCITNKSSPFIRHTGQELSESRFLISGLERNELAQLPPIPEKVVTITSVEKGKRRLVFIRLSANFSMSDLAPYDFADKYAKAYEESLSKNHKWIHILPEAIGFEDPLGLSIGMEEESLIKTCQDVGIIFQTGSYHFEYKEGNKGVVIAQGLENTIRKLQDDPKCANLLKKKLLDFFNNQTQDWIHGYLKDHERLSFPNEAIYRKNHGDKYINQETNYSYPIPPHNIPSYILEEIEKRVEGKGA